MSSTMLEQAIIDAKSLKEAAVKTAEEELLKKYSSQIKEAVENLLEQDEDPLTIGEDTSTETEDVVEELEMKALDGESNSDLEEGEMVELDLDALKEELEEAAKPDFLDLDKDGDKEEPMKKAAEEAEEMKEAVDVEDPEQPLDADEIAEEIEITEENIAAAIEEILKVDYETVPRGDLGTTHPTKAQQEYAVDATLAKNESDDDEGDVYNPPLNVKELEENIKKLQEELDSVNLEKNKINE